MNDTYIKSRNNQELADMLVSVSEEMSRRCFRASSDEFLLDTSAEVNMTSPAALAKSEQIKSNIEDNNGQL